MMNTTYSVQNDNLTLLVVNDHNILMGASSDSQANLALADRKLIPSCVQLFGLKPHLVIY